MFAYEQFAAEFSWDPRIVDELTLEEEFWLPVVRQAKTGAAEALQAVREMQQPLRHDN
jgi:hypothetical protein